MNVIAAYFYMIGLPIDPEGAAAPLLGTESMDVKVLESNVTRALELYGCGDGIVMAVQLGGPFMFGAKGDRCVCRTGVGDDHEFTSGSTRVNAIPDNHRVAWLDHIGSLLKRQVGL